MIHSFFKKLPPSVSVPAFYCFITGALFFRFLFASVYGVFFLVIGLYAYAKIFTATRPLTLSELVAWAVGLPSGYKIALLSSSVTIMGFVVAFHTATANWRNQMRAQLKAQAAGEIEIFFATVTSNITTTRLYVESLIEAVNKIQKEASFDDASFSVGYLQGKAREFMAARDILSQASIEVHRLIGRNYNLLSTGWGVIASARLAAESLSKVTKKMWIHLPMVDLKNPNHIQSFLNQVNVTECNEFLLACEVNYGKISGLSGGVQGYLTSPIWGFSLPMFANLISSRKEFKKAMREFHSQLRNEQSDEQPET